MNGALVPEWSGKFVEVQDEDMGLLPVHMDDTQTHQAPEGWEFADSYVCDDSEVFIYRRTS